MAALGALSFIMTFTISIIYSVWRQFNDNLKIHVYLRAYSLNPLCRFPVNAW